MHSKTMIQTVHIGNIPNDENLTKFLSYSLISRDFIIFASMTNLNLIFAI
jgi:hypothetical protein